MYRFLLRRFLCSSSSTTPAAGAGFIRELATLLAAGRFHASVGLAKSLLLSSRPPATSVPDLYHALVSTAAASQFDPHPPSFLSDAASALVVASARLGLPDGALRLLSLLADARATLPSLSSCNLLLESLLSLGRHADVRRAFDLLNAAGARPDTFTWNKAIQACVVAGDVDEAVRMLRRMDCEGHGAPAPNAFSYNVVIAGLWRAGRGSDAVEVFDEMGERAVLPSHITYNTMIDGHIKIGDLEAGFRLRDQMLHHGLKPNMITYNVLLSGLCRAGRIGETATVLHEMMSRKMVPDCFTYSILFDGYSRVGDSQAMLSLFEESVKKGVKIGAYTCSILLNGLCNDGKISKAEEVLQTFVNAGQLPTRVIYNTVINGYCQIGELEGAFLNLSEHEITPC